MMAREIILKLDLASGRRQLAPDEIAFRAEHKHKCLGLSSLERTIAYQWARVRFLADGDTSTEYFHPLSQGRKC